MSTTTLDTTAVRRWKRYPEYKLANHSWLESIPSGWELKRISWLFGLMGSGTTPSTGNESCFGGDIRWVNTGDLNDSVIAGTQKTVTETALREYSALKMYPAGTLLVALYGATIGKLGILAEPAVTNQACFAMAEPNGVSTRFVFYWLLGNRAQVISMSYGGGQPNISGELIRRLRICVPPPLEQRAIAAFLDRETARIDALIERKERLIALLEEKRQAVISHAVTRGLDAAAPLKDSGVPWLGRHPTHWKVLPMGWLAEVCNGATPSQSREDYWEDGVIPWVSSGEVNEDVITTPTAWITVQAFRDTSLRMIPSGSVLMGMIGQGRTRGMTAILGIEVCINQNAAAIIPRPLLDSEYLRYALIHAYEPIRQVGRGGQQGALNCELIRAIKILVPPKEEQKQITAFLNDQSRQITELVELLGRHNLMLQHYRTALISAAVTGQIDVREEIKWPAP